MDKSMLGDLQSLSEEDNIKMSAMIEQLQIRDRICQSIDFLHKRNQLSTKLAPNRKSCLRMYNSLVERCFNDCVDTFKHKSLQKQEESCVRRCAEKFLKHSMRVGMRFAELNQGAATQD
ncbi:Mitochondrial import inner membrane translocase subunit Tim9 [Morus notabilis]|uniref:Mitochondrial import inner membrane translocase subunit n=1 Tax=Morus notabilis TaxID=981085 RepID=W9S284_9ROSA|nr:Mitochondrial import inner membrane translocase subunit Tim9 [Morus notabilis]